jgi:hypothetical protein
MGFKAKSLADMLDCPASLPEVINIIVVEG